MRRLAVLPVLVLACGCGGGGGGPDAATADVVGRIEIEEADLGSVIGSVASLSAAFEDPTGIPDLVDDGTCRIYEYPCLGSVGACAGRPGHSAGTITIAGLASAITLVPDAETHSYAPPGGLPADLFADGAAITATATGAEVPAFSFAVTGVSPMASPYVDATLGLVPGQPLDLTWTAGADGALVQLRVNWANVCHAGAEWYVLVCEVADTGAFTVPAAITGVLPSGFGQCGARLARVRRATVPGRDVELVVASSDYFGFF